MQQIVQRQQGYEDLPLAFVGCKTQMHRTRREAKPPLPRTIAQINLTGKWSTTLAGDSFITHQDNTTVIFATQKNMQINESNSPPRVYDVCMFNPYFASGKLKPLTKYKRGSYVYRHNRKYNILV